jgi:hypothetical protein
VIAAVAAGALLACATTVSAGDEPYHPKFDPRNFVVPGKNALLSLTPGKQTVRKGLLNVGHRRVEHVRVYTITDVVKKIDGVPARAVLDQDFDAGEVAEQAIDYLAADKLGNIWYFGSYTESYEGGRFVNQLDSWLAGVRGAQPGILVPARPRVGMRFFRDRIQGEEADIGRVLKTNGSTCVPYGCFKKVVILEEPGGDEWKYYVAGVGGIWTRPVDKSDPAQETELLLNAKVLTPKGLAAISKEVLRLDRHSRTTAPSIYGRSQLAARSPKRS